MYDVPTRTDSWRSTQRSISARTVRHHQQNRWEAAIPSQPTVVVVQLLGPVSNYRPLRPPHCPTGIYQSFPLPQIPQLLRPPGPSPSDERRRPRPEPRRPYSRRWHRRPTFRKRKWTTLLSRGNHYVVLHRAAAAATAGSGGMETLTVQERARIRGARVKSETTNGNGPRQGHAR